MIIIILVCLSDLITHLCRVWRYQPSIIQQTRIYHHDKCTVLFCTALHCVATVCLTIDNRHPYWIGNL